MTMQVASDVARLLKERNLTIACAESCTGGMLMHELTNLPGSSAYMLGGIVAYSNAAKHALLGVQEHTLNVFGSVSEQVAAAMARGVRAALGANIAIGITGIAGPNGGTPDKPVGLTYISYITADMTVVRRYVWDGDRFANKAASVHATLKLILEQLNGPNS